jgi:Transcriptional regulators
MKKFQKCYKSRHEILLKQKQKSNIMLLTHQRFGGRSMNIDEQVISDFRDLYNKMSFLNRIKMEESLKGFKPSEVHCIESIGRNPDSNVTKLAETFYMTRGAISKLTKKLIEKGVIESYQRPDNKKEIYFRLTEQGKAIYETHEKMHNEYRERDKAIFEQVTEEQIQIMLGFMEKYSRHLDMEIKKMNIDIKSE